MLKAHQASIDLEQDCLRIKGRTVRFLPEHELPDNARMEHAPPPESADAPSTSSNPAPGHAPTPPRFPGSGNSLGSGSGSGTPGIPGVSQNNRPGSRPTPGSGTPNQMGGMRGQTSRQTPTPAANASQFPEKDIQMIIGMGVSRQVAIQTLEAAGGNVDLAASLLF